MLVHTTVLVIDSLAGEITICITKAIDAGTIKVALKVIAVSMIELVCQIFDCLVQDILDCFRCFFVISAGVYVVISLTQIVGDTTSCPVPGHTNTIKSNNMGHKLSGFCFD